MWEKILADFYDYPKRLLFIFPTFFLYKHIVRIVSEKKGTKYWTFGPGLL